MNIVCLEEIVSSLVKSSVNEINFDKFTDIILENDLIEYSMSLLAFLKLLNLFDHNNQKILFQKMFELSKFQKKDNIRKKMARTLIWSWNNIDLLKK